jgi:hypothetical protein
VMARLVWNFDLFNVDDAHEWDPEGDFKNIKAFSTWQKPRLLVKAVDRRMPGSRFWTERKKGEK